MAEGEASCATEWAAFVQQNISSPIVANVTAGCILAIVMTHACSHLIDETSWLSCCRMLHCLLMLTQATAEALPCA